MFQQNWCYSPSPPLEKGLVDESLKDFLDSKVEQYNQPAFIPHDPICIPHLYTKKQDIEIAAFFAAVFAWGNRTIIINKSRQLMQLMDNAPHDFILHHSDDDLKPFLVFKHRTFNITDLLYFIEFLRFHYLSNQSLESAFSMHFDSSKKEPVEQALINFHHY